MPTLLEYSPPAARPVARYRRRWTWLVLGLPAAVVPFVHFTCSASPVGVVADWITDRGTVHLEDVMFLGLAAGLIAGLPIFLYRLRLLWRRPLGQFERTSAFMIAAGTSVGFLLAWSLVFHESNFDASAWAAVISSAAFFVVGAFGLWLARHVRPAPDFPLASMLVPYCANGIFCLIAFVDKPQLGWYLTLVSATAAVLELITTGIAAILRWRRAWLAQTEGPAG